MAQPYVGEIRMFAGNFAPAGWQFCDGQILPISENETLFNLIGTTYGGDGQSTFALPNLQSRVPIHQGQGVGLSNRQLSETGGTEEVTLTIQQIPAHSHALLGSSANASDANPAGNVLATSTLVQPYAVESIAGNLAPSVISPAGGSQPHTNFQPYLCVSFIISLFGIFPSPT
jgi:microcystin-dependent protein